MLGANKKGVHEFNENQEGGFTKSLISTRRNELQAFANALKDENLHKFVASPSGDEAFSQVIALAVNDYGVSQKDLATAVGVNSTTVSRWSTGSSLPLPYGRGGILNVISTLLEHEIAIS